MVDRCGQAPALLDQSWEINDAQKLLGENISNLGQTVIMVMREQYIKDVVTCQIAEIKSVKHDNVHIIR